MQAQCEGSALVPFGRMRQDRREEHWEEMGVDLAGGGGTEGGQRPTVLDSGPRWPRPLLSSAVLA